MAGFNKVKKNIGMTTSHEGGVVFEKSPVDEWINFLFSSFMEDTFYETAENQQKRFLELTDQIANAYGYEFVAKCAVFARNELGMRSVSQLIAGWLNDKSFENKRAFYRAFCHRPDDVAEMFAAVDFLGAKRSHAMVRGCGDYLSNIDAYTLGKYKLNSREYNMFDLINITHATSGAINDYKVGMLDTPDTWETKISTAKSVEERNAEWIRLVEENRLGYMALIRNLNNILACGVSNAWVSQYLIPQLTNRTAIRKSLVFPYRIYTAYKNLNINNFKINDALSEAFTIAIGNVPMFTGNTAILLDVSGSMQDPISANSKVSIKEIGACFAVGLFLANPNTTIIKFGSYAKELKLDALDNDFTLIDRLCANDGCGYGTEVIPAFRRLSACHKDFDRIFLISDMQIMDNYFYYGSRYYSDYGNRYSNPAVNVYREVFGNIPCYSFYLGNYHSQVLNSNCDNIHYVTALNDQVLKFIGLLENGADLVSYINSFNYC